jgi:hypothetical protein
MRRRRAVAATDQRVLARFFSYVQRQKNQQQPLTLKIEAFLGSEMRRKILKSGSEVHLRTSSLRTTAGSLIGALQLHLNKRLDSPRIRQIFRWFQKELRKSTLQKARPITPGDIRKLAGFSEEEYVILLCACVTCQRMTTMKSLTHIKLDKDDAWELTFRHKTESSGIQGHIKVPVERLPSLVAHAKTLKRQQPESMQSTNSCTNCGR